MLTKWVKDDIQELAMKRVGLQFRAGVQAYKKNVNLEASKSQNIRPSQGYDENHTAELAMIMETGVPFKMPVLWQPPRARMLQVAHGVHRSAASFELLDESELLCYLITGPDNADLPILVDTYARIANKYDKQKPTTIEDDYLQARFFIKQRGMTCRRAADLLGMKEGLVQKYLRQDEVCDELRERGVDVKDLSRGHFGLLSPFHSAVRAAFATLMVKHRLTTVDAPTYAKNIKAKKSDAEQLREIEKVDKLLRKAHRAAPSEMHDVRVLRAWQRIIGQGMALLSTRDNVRVLLNILTTEDLRLAREFAEKLNILGDYKHAASKREEKIIGSASDTAGVAATIAG